jgi:uncharacterized protein (DUF1015 family)
MKELNICLASNLFRIKETNKMKEFEVGFHFYPSNINEIKALADNNLTMPPKALI